MEWQACVSEPRIWFAGRGVLFADAHLKGSLRRERITLERLHEYKRQLLLVLYIMVLYNRLKSNPA
jgi:hypothetical protein